MWMVDGRVSQVPLIKFDLLARVSRDEPAPKRIIKTYQNMILLLILSYLFGEILPFSLSLYGVVQIAVVLILRSLTFGRGRFDGQRPLH
jgi:hypothetical protein